MWSSKVTFAIFLTAVLVKTDADTSSLSSYVKLCSASDPGLDECAKAAAQQIIPTLGNGIPELGIKPVEPLIIGDILQDMSVLKFSFKDCKVYGLSNAKVDDLKIDQKKRRITLTLTNSGHMDALYKVSGQLLIIPVTGEGKSVIKMKGITYVFRLYYDVVKGEDGKDHWIIRKHKVTYTPTGVSFKFENLFNGSKQLADAVHSFANNNWKDIFTEIGTPMMVKLTNAIADNIKGFFAKVPLEDLLLP